MTNTSTNNNSQLNSDGTTLASDKKSNATQAIKTKIRLKVNLMIIPVMMTMTDNMRSSRFPRKDGPMVMIMMV